ncbi:hypothetical protein BGX26_011047 [Mortierella sp. AD094]|nr:hypothetical protein BGX26_011047 [Mortierella sp. AD094]
MLTLEGKQWFREVVLEYVDDLQRELYPLMPYFQAVTSIYLNNSTQKRICLHAILTGCSAIRNLEIKSTEIVDYYNPSKIVRNDDAPALPTTLRLQRLAISEMLLHQPVLETILATAPYLSELSLIGILKTSHDTEILDFDRVSFLELVSGTYPRIESLHFSFKDVSTFESDHELETHLSLFPVLHSFSFASKDATAHTLRLTQTLYQNRLTTLEVVKIGATPLFLSEIPRTSTVPILGEALKHGITSGNSTLIKERDLASGPVETYRLCTSILVSYMVARLRMHL